MKPLFPDIGEFAGMRVIASPFVAPVQNIRIRDEVPCTDEDRARINAWLLETFGTHHVAYIIGGNTVALHPDVYKVISR